MLRANEFAGDYLTVAFLRETWFLDAQGKMRWIHEGYGGDAKCLDTLTAKLTDVLEGR